MHTPPPNPSRLRREPSRWGRLVLLMALLAGGHGCRAITRNPYDKIEAELRTRERELAEARGELENSRLLNEAYARTPRTPCPDDGRATFLPLKEIVLGSGTGGADNDNQPGDEALQVVIVPRDSEASAVKVPASAVIFAYEVATNGTKTAIGRWDVPADTLRKNWRSGLFATGYYLTLQWDRLPAYPRLRVVVRLTTLDGRDYEAEREVSVRLVPGGGGIGIGERCEPTPAVPVVPFGRPVDELPPPRESRSNRPATIAPARSADR